MSRKTSSDFSFNLSGHIWKSVVDGQQGLLLMEIRRPDEYEMTWFQIDLRNYGLKEMPVRGRDWWSSVLVYTHPLLIVEKYEDPQDLTLKSMIVYDLDRQEILNETNDFQFCQLEGDELIGHSVTDYSRRKTIKIPDYGLNGRKADAELNYPVYYAPETKSYSMVHSFLEIEPSGIGCEYFEFENRIIISYYVRSGTKFDRKLLVLKGDSELCHEVLDEGLAGFASGAFFIWENLLVFVKNRNQINGVKL